MEVGPRLRPGPGQDAEALSSPEAHVNNTQSGEDSPDGAVGRARAFTKNRMRDVSFSLGEKWDSLRG